MLEDFLKQDEEEYKREMLNVLAKIAINDGRRDVISDIYTKKIKDW